jgi:fumarate reductase flavoprotein subunit
VALEAAKNGLSVTILSLVPPKRSHSSAAQGGMQAALGNAAKGKGDNPTIHFLDTVRGSDWGADQEVVRLFVDNAPVAMREMAHYGVPWNRVKGGPAEVFIKGKKQTIVEDEKKDGLITARSFGGTAKWRTCYTADGTGHSVLFAMDNLIIQHTIEVHDRMEAVSLIHGDGRCYGAIARSLRDGSLSAYYAKSTVIGTGGFGRIYGASTNAVINEGTGAAIALNTGIVPLGNMEAVQFHPTGILPTDILVTEGCRGDGGFLVDKNGHRFMPDYEPDKQDLASRDVVSRRMTEHIKKGFGVESPYGKHLWLDVRHLGKKHLTTKLREVYDICMYFIGVNPITELIPVRPTQHYSMGGIRVNKDGHAYSMEGLFSVGESACWDMHGFNRLGGNSLAETVVAGMICGKRVAEYTLQAKLDISTTLGEKFKMKIEDKINSLYKGKGNESIAGLKKEMADILLHDVGIFRNAKDLEHAKKGLKNLLQRSKNIKVRNASPGRNPELTEALKLEGMIKLAMTIAYGAYARKESRGAHTREDYPLRDDNKWLNRTLARWPEKASEPVLSYEPVGIIDLPPGERGYGAATSVKMKKTVKQYNTDLDKLQKKAGRIEPAVKVGKEMKMNLWKKEVR